MRSASTSLLAPASFPAVPRGVLFFCLSLLGSLSACQGGPEDPPGLGHGLPVWTVEPELEIGSVDGPVVLGSVLTAAEGPDGTLHLLEFGEARIQRFTPSGDPLPHLGQEGEGPGEFIRPSALGWDDQGLWVLDTGANRLSWFDEEDELLETLQWSSQRLDPGELAVRLGAPLGDGTFMGISVTGARQIAQGIITHTPLLRTDADESMVDTLAVTPVEGDLIQITENPAQGGMIHRHPFPTAPIRQVLTGRPHRDPEVVLVEWEWEPEPVVHVLRRSVEGDTLSHTVLDVQPIPIPAQRLEEEVERIAELYAQSSGGMPAQARSLVEEVLDAPSYLRPVEEVLAGPQGAIWLQLAHLPEDGADEETPGKDGERWMELDASGEATRLLHLPPSWTLKWVGSDHIWAVQIDELGVNTVVRARLVT
jgi:hypothetical protein